jgi:hypothetical protein
MRQHKRCLFNGIVQRCMKKTSVFCLKCVIKSIFFLKSYFLHVFNESQCRGQLIVPYMGTEDEFVLLFKKNHVFFLTAQTFFRITPSISTTKLQQVSLQVADTCGHPVRPFPRLNSFIFTNNKCQIQDSPHLCCCSRPFLLKYTRYKTPIGSLQLNISGRAIQCVHMVPQLHSCHI